MAILDAIIAFLKDIPIIAGFFKKPQPTTDEQAIQKQVDGEANQAKDPGSRPQW